MDLQVRWLGFDLPHPFIVGACPLADTVESAKRVEDAGAAALVMRSLFEEQIRRDSIAVHAAYAPHEESFAEATNYTPQSLDMVFGPDEYLEQVRQLKEALQIPVIASLNGNTPGGWLDYARQIEQAGADALELNLYDVPMDPTQSSSALEAMEVEMVRTVTQSVEIPVSVKLSPFYSGLAHFVQQLEDAGVAGIVMFNRFFEPDIDVDQLEVRTQLHMSGPRELLLRLRWLAILNGCVDCPLAVSGGVQAPIDAIKATMAGAIAIQVVSSLLTYGPDQLRRFRDGVVQWLLENEYESLAQARGSMNIQRCPDPGAYARSNYMRVLQTWQG